MPQRVPARIELKPAQQLALAALGDGRLQDLTRGAYQELTGMSRSQAAYDLADLVEAGILERVGGGRSTHYRLLQEPTSAHRRWTTDRIRAELDRFCRGKTSWPSASEFKAAGHADLYVAASRYGGIAFWAAELGFPRTERVRRPEPEPSPARATGRLSWALAGALLGAVLVAAGTAIVLQWPNGPQQLPTALGSTPAQIVGRQSAGQSHARTSVPASQSRRSAKRSISGKGQSHSQRRSQVTRATPAPQAELAVRRVSPTGSSSQVVLTRNTASQPPPPGPTPIRAPIVSASTPSPLPHP